MAAPTVVGAAPVVLTKKGQAAAKRMANAPSLHAPTPPVVEKGKNDHHHDDGEGRPNKAAYDAEQDALRAEIDALQSKANEIKARIAATSSGKGGPLQERKVQLRATLDQLRGEQARIKGGRGKTMDQVKAAQEGLSKKIKDLQAAKAKLPFKSVAEVENQIKNLERQVESGTMKLVDEKKALAEISSLKKTRKTVDSFSAQQNEIDEEKKKIDDMRAGLEDPEAKAINDKFNEAKAELDAINKKNDEASKGRDGLYDERNAISKQLDVAFTKKKESALAFREANNKFYEKLNADRAKRLERQRLERQSHEESKRAEVNERLLDEAQAPAFERDIEDCRTLIDFFQRRIGITPTATGPVSRLGGDKGTNGLPQLSQVARTVEAPEGLVAVAKKGSNEDDYFMGGKKGKKGPRPVVAGATAPVQALNLPFGTLSALLALGITSPITVAEVPQTIEALEAKKKYFENNQDRVTKERIAAVEKKIAQAEAKSKGTNGTATPVEAAAPAPVVAPVEAAAEPVEAPAVAEEKKEAEEEKEEGEIEA